MTKNDLRTKADLSFWPGRPRKLSNVPVEFKRRIDERFLTRIREFIGDSLLRLGEVGLQHVVVGLSGGLDSTVTAALCRESLGDDRVTAITVDLGVPSHGPQTAAARSTARDLHLRHVVIDASKLHDSSLALLADDGPFTRINVSTRCIHGTLFQYADAHMAGVASTVNKSEELLARHMECFYGHFAPLADLYKSEVVELAALLGTPERVLAQEPGCADAWRDIEVLGAGYDVLDPILHLLTEEGWSAHRVADTYGLDEEWMDRLERRVRCQCARMTTRVFRV